MLKYDKIQVKSTLKDLTWIFYRTDSSVKIRPKHNKNTIDECRIGQI